MVIAERLRRMSGGDGERKKKRIKHCEEGENAGALFVT